MRNLRKRPSANHGSDDEMWSPAADLMSGLLLLFMVILAVTIARAGAAEKQADENQAVVEALEQQIGADGSVDAEAVTEAFREAVQVRNRMEAAEQAVAQMNAELEETSAANEALQRQVDALRSLTAHLDALDLANTVVAALITDLATEYGIDRASATPTSLPISSDLLFDNNSYRLKPEGEQFLAALVPELAQRLLSDASVVPLIERVVIEGHSSWRGEHMHNMLLSTRRAVSVYGYIRYGMPDFANRAAFVHLSTPSGRGALDANRADENDPADRRVELRVEFATAASGAQGRGDNAP
jgi:chemotaxis protein MotB